MYTDTHVYILEVEYFKFFCIPKYYTNYAGCFSISKFNFHFYTLCNVLASGK